MAASTLITVAPTGAEADKSAVPALPVTLAELVVTAKECEAAGAAVYARVGMEDTLTFSRGRPVARNAELVERAADLARLAQRPPMPPAEARAFLAIPAGST